jgi:hypothetical protein
MRQCERERLTAVVPDAFRHHKLAASESYYVNDERYIWPVRHNRDGNA